MVLIQLLLPTTGAHALTAWRRSLRRGENWRSDSMASRRICDPPRRDCGQRPMATLNRTTSSWWKS